MFVLNCLHMVLSTGALPYSESLQDFLAAFHYSSSINHLLAGLNPGGGACPPKPGGANPPPGGIPPGGNPGGPVNELVQSAKNKGTPNTDHLYHQMAGHLGNHQIHLEDLLKQDPDDD